MTAAIERWRHRVNDDWESCSTNPGECLLSTYHTTDHGPEVTVLRWNAETNRGQAHLLGYPAASAPPDAKMHMMLSHIQETAAALLEVHDDTGISLDNWKGPRELVEFAIGREIHTNEI